jgi:hypothetical protein
MASVAVLAVTATGWGFSVQSVLDDTFDRKGYNNSQYN